MGSGKENENNSPGHIGLISENQPGITAEIESGCVLLLLESVSKDAGAPPFSSSSLGLFTGKSAAAADPVSAMKNMFFLFLCYSAETIKKTKEKSHSIDNLGVATQNAILGT